MKKINLFSMKKSETNICPICDSRQIRIFEKNKSYYCCSNCQGVFLCNILPQIEYLNHITYLSDPKDYIQAIDPKGFRYLLDKFDTAYSNKIHRDKGNLLEIGAGVGFFLFQCYARGWEIEGLETSNRAVKWANENLKLDLKNLIIEDYVTQKKYDAFVMIEVIEHLRDPISVLLKLKKISNSSSLLFFTTPNIESNYWNESRNIFDPNDHIVLFSKKSINEIFRKCDIDNPSIEYFGGDEGDAHFLVTGIIHS